MHRQLARTDRFRPGLAVVIVGGNDSMLPVSVGRAARQLTQALDRLRSDGWETVVVPCPDPASAPGFRVLVRLAASRRARRLARLQTRAALRVGAAVGPSSTDRFRDHADVLLSPDGVHPSAQGYADYAQQLLPAVLAVLSVHLAASTADLTTGQTSVAAGT